MEKRQLKAPVMFIGVENVPFGYGRHGSVSALYPHCFKPKPQHKTTKKLDQGFRPGVPTRGPD